MKPQYYTPNEDLCSDIIAMEQKLLETKRELWALQKAAIEECPYKVGEKYVVVLENGQREVGFVCGSILHDVNLRDPKIEVYTGFNKCKQDGTMSSHRLQGVMQILNKID